MAKHFHIHFAPRRTRDQAAGSVPQRATTGRHPPAHVNALVHALFQAIAARQGMTQDAGFDESKHKRDAGGRFAVVGADGDKQHMYVYRGSNYSPVRDLEHYKQLVAGHNVSFSSSMDYLEDENPTDAMRNLHSDIYDYHASGEHEKTLTRTTDAGEWDESKHPRGEGGRFSSAEHTAAAENHETAAMGHGHASTSAGAGPLASMHTKASMAHTEAAEAHRNAAKHIDAGTGLGDEFATQAHSKTYQAAGHSQKLEGLAGGNMMGAAHAHLKKIASDPKQPVAKRAEAAEQLAKLEKTANAVANSPHAKKQSTELEDLPDDPDSPAALRLSRAVGNTGEPKPKKELSQQLPSVRGGPSTGQRDPGEKFAGAMAANKGGSGSMESAAAKAGGGEQPAGAKPTQATQKAAKAATHELLSSGHPFSVDELMKATGVTNKATIMTALSDLKNPKYAGALGALQIEKQPDGMYRVTKAPAGGFKAVGQAPAGGAAAPPAPGSTAAPSDAPSDPHAVVHGSHPLSDYVPGDHVKAKVGTKAEPWKVLGHNAEGHVVLQKGDGAKHRMDPKQLASMTNKVAAPGAPTEPVSVKEATNQAYGKAEGLKPGPGNTNVRQGTPLEQPKPGPDGKPMGTHPELKKAAVAAAANPGTTPKRGAGSMVPAPTGERPATPKGKPISGYGKADHMKAAKQHTAAAEWHKQQSKAAGDKHDMAAENHLSAAASHEHAGSGATVLGGRRSHESWMQSQIATAYSQQIGGAKAEAGYGRGNLDNVPQNGQAGVKPVKGATATGQSFMQRVPISKAKGPAMVVDPISHRTSMAGGVPHKSPEPGEPGYEQWKANRDKRLGKA